MEKYRKFHKYEDSVHFAQEWLPYFESLTEYKQNMLLNVKAKGRWHSNPDDRPVIKYLYKVIKEIPACNENIILYRGGSENDFCKNRPFLAASFSRDVAKSFAKHKGCHIYKIKVKKGSKIIPICGMNILGCQAELEVVVETKKLHRVPYSRTFMYY